MARHGGLFTFSGNFEPQFAEPLDARLRVKTKEALYDINTWTSKDGGVYVYRYMLVAVYEDPIQDNNGFYYLDNVSDVTNPNNWKRLYEDGNRNENAIRVFESLPKAGPEYRGCLAFIDNNKSSDDALYICIKKQGKYIWTLFTHNTFINSETPETNSVLGMGALGKMILGSGEPTKPTPSEPPSTNSTLGEAVLGGMVLGKSN